VTPSPIALFAYNRPDLLAETVKIFDKFTPTLLFLISDGPKNNLEDINKVAQVRSILSALSSRFTTIQIFRNSNLGCKQNIVSGISEVFQQVDSCIFLEDDTLPSLSFFPYCDQLLERYRDDPTVATVSGTKFFTEYQCRNKNESYFFSRYPQLWGWATWKWKWEKYYDPNLSTWPSIKKQKRIVKTMPFREEIVWREYWEEVYTNKIDTWDRQLGFAFFENKLLSAIPRVNLVRNIGFGHVDATHTTKRSWQGNLKTGTLNFPLGHPKLVRPEIGFDKLLSNHFAPNLSTRAKNKFSRIRSNILQRHSFTR
jgi:hypothetical protein